VSSRILKEVFGWAAVSRSRPSTVIEAMKTKVKAPESLERVNSS